jgi:hypothetical protein
MYIGREVETIYIRLQEEAGFNRLARRLVVANTLERQIPREELGYSDII